MREPQFSGFFLLLGFIVCVIHGVHKGIARCAAWIFFHSWIWTNLVQMLAYVSHISVLCCLQMWSVRAIFSCQRWQRWCKMEMLRLCVEVLGLLVKRGRDVCDMAESQERIGCVVKSCGSVHQPAQPLNPCQSNRFAGCPMFWENCERWLIWIQDLAPEGCLCRRFTLCILANTPSVFINSSFGAGLWWSRGYPRNMEPTVNERRTFARTQHTHGLESTTCLDSAEIGMEL